MYWLRSALRETKYNCYVGYVLVPGILVWLICYVLLQYVCRKQWKSAPKHLCLRALPHGTTLISVALRNRLSRTYSSGSGLMATNHDSLNKNRSLHLNFPLKDWTCSHQPRSLKPIASASSSRLPCVSSFSNYVHIIPSSHQKVNPWIKLIDGMTYYHKLSRCLNMLDFLSFNHCNHFS